MEFSDLFEGVPPEPPPNFASVFDAVHWGCARGMSPTPKGAGFVADADRRGMMFRAECPDDITRQIPCSVQQQNLVGRLLGFLSRKVAQCPPGMSADIELLERYARITRRMLAELGPLPWDFDADAFGLAAGPWWRKVRDVPAWADEFTEAAKGRFEKLAAAVPQDYAARVCGILAMKGGEFSALVRVLYWIRRGMLPDDFSEIDLARFARVNGIPLTPRGEELLAGTASGGSPSAGTPFKQSGHLAVPSVDAAESAAHKGKGTLAEQLGITAWHELHVVFSTEGLRVKKAGNRGNGRLVSWQALGWKVEDVNLDERFRFLGRMAAGNGSFQESNGPDVSSRRKRVAKELCAYFGLPGERGQGPLFYQAGRSQTRFGVFCLAKETREKRRGETQYADDKLTDRERKRHEAQQRNILHGIDDEEDRM